MRSAPDTLLNPNAGPEGKNRRLDLTEILSTIRFPVLVFIASVGLFLIARDYANIQSHQNVETPWDAAWYRRVIETGYQTDGNPSVYHNVAFFPLYPLACSAVIHVFGLTTPQAMLIVSAGCTAAMLVLLYSLLLPIYAPFVAKTATILMAFGPFSQYLYNGYSEPLYLLLLTAFFWLLLHQRYIAAAVLVGIASGGRPQAPLLGLVLCFELGRQYYRTCGLRLRLNSPYIRQLVLSVPLCFTGLALYTLWLYQRFGDPLAFSHAYEAWNTEGSLSGWRNFFFFHYVLQGVAETAANSGFINPKLIGLVFFVATLALFLWLRKRLFPAAAFFAGMMLLLLHASTLERRIEIYNLGRHLTLLLPVPLLLALAVEPGRIARALSDPQRQKEDVSQCLYAIARIPSMIIVAGCALLYLYYTVMFYQQKFVS